VKERIWNNLAVNEEEKETGTGNSKYVTLAAKW